LDVELLACQFSMVFKLTKIAQHILDVTFG